MSLVYQFSVNNGDSLPAFRADYTTLMKYKEYIGDRVVNDLLYGVLKESLAQDSALFIEKQNKILNKKKVNLTGLVKQLAGIIKSEIPPEKKEEVLGTVLRRNGFHVDDASVLTKINNAEIKNWLAGQQPNVVEKGLTTKLFNALYGGEYETMQKEIVKYEFKKEAKGKGKEYTFLLSKRKVHSAAMFNMGVCVAPDDTLWNSPDFWQLIIFDEDRDAHGGVIIRTIEEDGKKYLILSINPASSILSEIAPVQVFDEIIIFCKEIAKKLKYTHTLIPEKSAIHSNRGSIQTVISKRYGKQKPLELKNVHEFSYSPHNYKYKKFYVA